MKWSGYEEASFHLCADSNGALGHEIRFDVMNARDDWGASVV